MAEKVKKKKLKINDKLIIASIAVILVIIIFLKPNSANTTTILSETVESSFSGKGIISYYEDLYYAEEEGEVLYAYSDGTRVLQGKKIATLYTGEMDETTKEKLKAANEQLAAAESKTQYKSVVTNDTATLRKDMSRIIGDIAKEAAELKYDKVYESSSQLNIYNEKVCELEGIATGKANSQDEAVSNINYIENSISGQKKDFFSYQSGVFSNYIDPLDGLFTPEDANSLTADRFRVFANYENNATEENKSVVCKVINNYEWYLSTLVSADELQDLEVGSEVKIRIKNKSNDAVAAEVTYISETDAEDMAVITMKSTKYIENLFDIRFADCEIVRHTYTGLKVPAKAVFEKDGVRGVLAIKDSVARFIPLDIIYEEKNFVLVSRGETVVGSDTTELVLYDLVITNYKRIAEGSIVR